jgi:hypothetical protein
VSVTGYRIGMFTAELTINLDSQKLGLWPGGKGIVPGRPHDRFGIGLYYSDVKSPEFRGLLQTRRFLRDEYGFEAFYNFALTPWLQLTPDLQIVRGAQKEKITIGSGPLGLPIITRRRSIGTATIVGLRLRMVLCG